MATIGELEVEVRANFDRLVAQLEARLREIARRQAIQLRVQIREQSLGRLNKQLKSFSGINSLQKSFQSAGEHVTSFFDNIGGIARKMTLLGGAIGPVITGLASLAPAIAAVGTAAAGALAAAPGLMAGFAASTFVFIQAFKQVPSSVQSSIDKFSVITKIIGKNFWAEATGGVQLLLKSALEPLKAGFGTLATAAGEFTSHLAGSLSRAFTPAVYKTFFAGVSEGFRVLDHGFTDAFASISAKLLIFGAQLIPRIAQGIEDVTVKFDRFLKANPTFLADSFETFVTILKGVASAIGSVIGIFGGLARATEGAGIGAANLASPLKVLSDAINSVAGQSAITSFLTQMRSGMEGLFRALGPLGGLLANLAPILGAFVQTAGTVLGGVFERLFTSLNRPEVLTNISGLLQAFPKIFENIAPSIDLVVNKFSELAGVAAVTVEQLSLTLNSALQAILPALTPLFGPIKALVVSVGEALRMAFAKIGPALQQLAPYFATLISAANDFFKALQNPAAQFIIDLILNFVTTAVKGFVNLATAVFKVVTGLLQVLSGDFSGFGKIWDGIKAGITGAFQLFITFFAPAKILGLVGRAFGNIATRIVPPILIGLARLVRQIPVVGTSMARALLNATLAFLTRTVPTIGGNIIRGIIQGATAVIGGFLSWVSENIIDKVKSILGISSPSTVFAEIGRFLIEGLINGAKAIINGLITLFMAPINAIRTLFQNVFGVDIFAPIKAAFSVFVSLLTAGFNVLKTVGTVVWNVIKAAGSVIWSVLGAYFNAYKLVITTGIAVVMAVVNAVWTGIQAAGAVIWPVLSALFDAFKVVVTTGIAVVMTVVNAVWTRIQVAGAVIWTLLSAYFNAWKAVITVGIAVVMAVVNAVWAGIQAAGAVIWTVLTAYFNAWKAVISAGIAVVRVVITAVWNVLKAAGGAVWTFIQARFATFKANVSAGIAVIRAVVSAVWNVLKAVGGAVWDFIKARFATFKANVTAGINAVKSVASSAFNAIKAVGGAIWDFIKARFATFKSNVTAGVNALKSVASTAFNAIKTVASNIWGSITSAFNNAKSTLTSGVEGIKSAFIGAFNSIKDAVLGVFNTIKNSIPSISIPGLSKLPGFATGVTNFRGGLAMVGEQGPEIVNLPRGADVYNASTTRRMRDSSPAAGGDTFQVVVNLDVNDLDKMKTVSEFVTMLKGARVDARRTAGSGTVTV